MLKKLPYFLVLISCIVAKPLFAQQAETANPSQTSIAENSIHEKVGELQDKVFIRIDSLSNKSANLLQTTTDSLNNLSSKIEGKITSNIDSLQQKLNKIQRKGNQQLSHATEKADKITRRIDSLQNLLTNKMDKLNKYTDAIPGTDGIDKLQISEIDSKSIPGLKKLTLPGMKGLRGIETEILKRVQDDGLLGMDLPEYKLPSEVNEYSQMIKDPSQIDQIADVRASQMAEFKELGAQAEELEGLKGLPEDMLADLKRYQNEQALKEELKNKAVQKATDYMSAHMDKLTKAQGAMSALKKKYSYVPDSRDLSTAVKNTSLKNEPLKRRFRYGLGFQVHSTDPVSLDLSPNVQYRFNKLFSAGISGTYRANLQIENTTAKAAQALPDIYGVSALARYRLSFIKPGNKWLGGFFAHAGFEYMSTRPKFLKTRSQTTAVPVEEPARSWHPGLPLGIGKQMRLSKALTGVIIFTYDVLHDEYSPDPKAWNIKFGVQIGRFRLRDIHI